MTLIIGIRCSDGVVLASDGATTYSALGRPIKIEPTSKLDILHETIIMGTSGPVGLGQLFKHELHDMWEKGALRSLSSAATMIKIREIFWSHIKRELEIAQVASRMIGEVAAQDVLSASLVTLPLKHGSALFTFDQQAAPEEITDKSPFVSIGSGQAIADPFLALLRRIFWNKALPKLSEGVFAALWTLHHAVKTHPGGVADPKDVAVLEKHGSSWKARRFSELELQEHMEYVEEGEKHLASFKLGIKQDTMQESNLEIPEPEKNN